MFAVENKQQISNFCVYLELCLFIHRLGRINYAFNHSRESPDGVTTQDHISSSSTNEDENLSEEVDEFGNYLYIFPTLPGFSIVCRKRINSHQIRNCMEEMYKL